VASETVRRAYGFYVFNVFSNPKKHYLYVFFELRRTFSRTLVSLSRVGRCELLMGAHKKLVIVGHFYRVC